ncbi:MAG: hypothetical protein ABSH56_03900 [Bryobacteraceae bacterium]|jgi:beta-xylosidase
MRCRSGLTVLLLGASQFAALAADSNSPDTHISVDASRVIGRIKALNDVDNGPLCQRGIVDLSRYYKELGVRNVRLHDVAWTYDNVIDINYVFPKWEADSDRPENYDFTQTDYYLNTISSLGINIIFRLGYSAEYKTSIRHNKPPDSYEKWADVCAHIVRHYNHGWANGRRLGIRYWEVWNEPDGQSLSFWASTPDEFYRLYETVARRLKSEDPALKVGGPGLAHDLNFLGGMLRYCQRRNVPLEFVSWHIYTSDVHQIALRARRVHDLMSHYGFSGAESILDEWNYGPGEWNRLFVDPAYTRQYFDATQDAFGAAFDATALTELQDAHVDVATFFSGTTFMWGLFTSSGAPQKAYYSFLAFRRMLDSPERIAVTSGDEPNVSVLAGVSEDKSTVRILVSNVSREPKTVKLDLMNLPWKGPVRCERQRITATADFERIDRIELPAEHASMTEVLVGPAVCLLTLKSGL